MTQFLLGSRQRFRHRHSDINILGSMAGGVKEAARQLNRGPKIPFYVKGMDPEKDRLCRNRLMNSGDFNIEIPVDDKDLIQGINRLRIILSNVSDNVQSTEMEFEWDPSPVALPLDLTDLSCVANIQEIGQVVNGAFEVVPGRNVIRTTEPVAKDSLLLLGSPHKSQEATYSVRFGGSDGMFLGLADFFAGHESAIPDIGIKVGWSSSGLATLRPNTDKCGQIWLAWGDLLEDDRRWAVKTDPPRPFPFETGEEYAVRHQVLFENGVNRARFRIWLRSEKEPDTWLCDESDREISPRRIKNKVGSFGLFQYNGLPTEWSNIKVAPIEV